MYRFQGRIRVAKERTMLAQHHMATQSSQRTSNHDAGCPWALVHRRRKRKGWKVRTSSLALWRCRGKNCVAGSALCSSSRSILRTPEAARNALRSGSQTCFSLHVYSLVNSTHGTVSYTRKNMPGVLSEELK